MIDWMNWMIDWMIYDLWMIYGLFMDDLWVIYSDSGWNNRNHHGQTSLLL